MHLTCTLAQAVFPSVGLRLFADQPLTLLWDCHHGDTFIVRVGGLSVATLPSPPADPSISLEVALAPATEVLAKMEHFAAHQNLAMEARTGWPEEMALPLTLAACHLPGVKLFVFSEQATLTARATPEGNLGLTVAGDFKSRTIPCQEADLVLHLERADASRLLSYCFSLVRGRV